jgi:hypothetical protein
MSSATPAVAAPLSTTPSEKRAFDLPPCVVSTVIVEDLALFDDWIAAAAFWLLARHHEGIVLTTSPTQRQVRTQLWSEIHRMVERARARGRADHG